MTARSLLPVETALALAVALALVLCGCTDDTLPQYVRLDRLRVLALKVDDGGGRAEVAAGGTLTITPYISDTQGGARELVWTAQSCLDPGIAYGAEPSCTGRADAITIATAAAMTEPAAPHRTGAVDSFTVTVPAASAVFAGRKPQERFNGVGYLVTYEIKATDGSGEQLRSFKRVVVSEKPVKNLNPSISDVLADGVPLIALPTSDTQLSVAFPAGSIEGYSSQRSDGSTETRTEQLLSTWFITMGEVKSYRTQDAATTTYSPPAAGTDTLIFVVMRDDRGGVAVIGKDL